MTERKKYILEGLGIILIIALIILLLFWLRSDREVETEEPDLPSTEDVRSMPRTEDVFDEEVRNNATTSPLVNARIFTERFGSFSSEADFGNLRDVYPIVTPQLRERLEALAESGRDEIREQYFGISTRIISSEILEETNSSASIRVSTQRVEATGSITNQQTRYQDITLSLINSEGNWLIADYEWHTN